MMEAVVFEGPGAVRAAAVPQPVPGTGEVRLRVSVAGICTTDLHILHGHFPVRPPRILGHELAGVVDMVGPGVAGDWLGVVCGVRPARFCGTCAPCRRGHSELCQNLQCLGNTRDGGFAEYALVPADQLVRLPGVPCETLVWLEPLACVIHALDASQAWKSEAAIIVGAGTLGRLMILALQATGRARVAVVDPNPEKVEQARALGADCGWVVPRGGATASVDEDIRAWAPDGVQAIVDTSGSPVAVERALRWAGPAGYVLLFGVSDPAASFPLYPGVILDQELHLHAASGMTPDSFDRAIELLQSKALDPSGLISAVVDLRRVPEVLGDGRLLRVGKVLVRPDGGSR